jgi:hypothetical protein
VGFFLHDKPRFLESLCEQKPPVKEQSPTPMLVLLLSIGVSEIGMRPKDPDDIFEPVGFFQVGQHLSTDLSSILL